MLLIDKAPFPREKVCGDGLIPDALGSLRRANLFDDVVARGHFARVLSAFSPSTIRVDLPGEFVTIRRRVFDSLLQQAAVAAGAAFQVAEATAISESDGGVTIRLASGGHPLRARVCIVATGADLSLLDCLGAPHRSTPSAVALRCYVRSRFAIQELIIAFHRSVLPAYGWIFPLGNGEYNVGCGVLYRQGRPQGNVTLRQTFEAFGTHFPLARQLMEQAVEVTRLEGARLRCGLERELANPGRRVLAVGETVGATYPFTGEGIGKAMETAEIAAEQTHRALSDGDLGALAAFPRRLETELEPRYEGYRIAERWLARAWLTDLVAWRVSRSAGLRRAAAGMLSETADPRAVFSWQLLLPRWLHGSPTLASRDR